MNNRRINIPVELYNQIHQLMPIVCVDTVVYADNKIFLVSRANEPEQGQWWFPGGRVLKNERLSRASHRIVKNEAGIDISHIKCLGHDETMFNTDPFGHGLGTHTVNFVFTAVVSELALFHVALDNHHTAYSMFSFEEIYCSDMHPYVKRFTALAEGVFRQ
jgi:colanic acid biosynthesis protein WcaH